MAKAEMEDLTMEVGTFSLVAETGLKLRVDRLTSDVTVELLSGQAEIFGTELELNKVYPILPSSSITLFTWHGCTVKLNGQVNCFERTDNSLITMHVKMHDYLEEQRVKAESKNDLGPVCMVVGPTDVGKTCFCRSLLNRAVKTGRKLLYINLDTDLGSVSMPGTVCALPIKTPYDITDGFDSRSIDVFHFGHNSPGYNIKHYVLLIKKLGEIRKSAMENNEDVRKSGVIIDTYGWVKGDGYRVLNFAAAVFEVNIIFVLEEQSLYEQLRNDMSSSVEIVYVPKQNGVAKRDANLRVKNRHKLVYEYFYGPRGNLQPNRIEVDFADLSVYTINEPISELECNINFQSVSTQDTEIKSVPLDPELVGYVVALSTADRPDENLPVATLFGFLCILNVDMHRKKLTLLSPQGAPLPSKICILGDTRLLNRDF